MIGGERDEVSEQTNIVPLPLTVRGVPPLAVPESDPMPTKHEFTEAELAALCRWFSAMKYAFPGTEGVMMVNHQENYSAVGLYNRSGAAPNCLVAKHEVGGAARFFWSTGFYPPRPICDLSQKTDAPIRPTPPPPPMGAPSEVPVPLSRAIPPPRDEKGWLDPAGWMGVYASRLIATELQV